MADRMLTVQEGAMRGLDPDPFTFTDITELVPGRLTEHARWLESRWFFAARSPSHDALGNEMVWLSLRRNDRKPLSDFRHLQRIKNSLCGEEWEAVQLYPAESRLLDESNQTHLWCYPPDKPFPFGYLERSVLTATEGAMLAASGLEVGVGTPVQRPFSDEIERNPRSLDEILQAERSKVAHTPREEHP